MISFARNPSQEQQHGAIAQPAPRIEVATVDRTLCMLRRYGLGHRRRSGPGGDRRHRGSERGGRFTTILCVAQERAHGVRDAFERRRLQTSRLALHERNHIAGKQQAQINGVPFKTLVEKLPGDGSVALDG
jgi:hypothetical protein